MPHTKSLVTKPKALCGHCLIRHSSSDCPDSKIISCRKCFRLNVRTENCECIQQKYSSPQVFRLVGNETSPKLYVDITAFNQAFPALINTSIVKCRINYKMSVWLQMKSFGTIDEEATELIVPFTRKGNKLEITCEIYKPQIEAIELGLEYLQIIGYTFTFEGVTINSDSSPIASHPQEVEFAYNLPFRGTELREHLVAKRKFLKKGRIAEIPNWPPQPASNRLVIVRRTKRRRSSD